MALSSSQSPDAPAQQAGVRLWQALAQQSRQLGASIAANPRLQWGLAGIALIAITSGLLTLDDQRTVSLRKIEAMRDTNASLRKQLGNSAQQVLLQARLDGTRAQIESSLWQFATPVVAQAEFSDWLNTTLKDSGARELKVTQPTFRYLNAGAPADTTADSTGNECTDGAQCELIELRAQLRFSFDPAGFAKTLATIENGDRAMRIEQMTLNTAERRVELTVQTLARLAEPTGKANASAAQAASSPATTDASKPADASASAPKPVVEVKW
ncbi:hypothetical protein IGB42_04129 [Andreprevotia sp. IGB-42]|uniref:hypothetical protein n=1 Tax=Andreprevotia sp. IGB-42 TaxID=2497473 RepID=UPI00135A5BA0|nr:hypothetical protein [Andreprevotia sp. IGB-42]KAF0811430.1 hypothetical protein IGB42_04129 [Andreprevotia sp. IGB-42]